MATILQTCSSEIYTIHMAQSLHTNIKCGIIHVIRMATIGKWTDIIT
jgi:hypothetical protein